MKSSNDKRDAMFRLPLKVGETIYFRTYNYVESGARYHRAKYLGFISLGGGDNFIRVEKSGAGELIYNLRHIRSFGSVPNYDDEVDPPAGD